MIITKETLKLIENTIEKCSIHFADLENVSLARFVNLVLAELEHDIALVDEKFEYTEEGIKIFLEVEKQVKKEILKLDDIDEDQESFEDRASRAYDIVEDRQLREVFG